MDPEYRSATRQAKPVSLRRREGGITYNCPRRTAGGAEAFHRFDGMAELVAVESVAIQPDSVTLPVGDARQFAAVVRGVEGPFVDGRPWNGQA